MIDIKQVHKLFNKGKANQVNAVNGIDLHIDKGEFVVMIGKGVTVAEPQTTVKDAVDELIRQGLPRMDALKTVAEFVGAREQICFFE